MSCEVLKCSPSEGGNLNITLIDRKTGTKYELVGVELTITDSKMLYSVIDYGLNVTGVFTTTNESNKITETKPLELTLADIEKKYGRKVKIVDSYAEMGR